ncbi:MAG TPA: ribosome biogenesis GTPase Der, partial [Rhodanobacteraceae bacterium]|nr:ribosome biogenesis GTPase Der [Rhodanobacteraceae bacterium]
MLPVVALVGRPNVGKSTLFNALTRRRDALVADLPGVTRDRHYGVCHLGTQAFMAVDTGGLSGADEGIDGLTAKQVRLAIEEAALVLLIVDARDGLTAQDRSIVEEVRRSGKPLELVVNKTDGLDEQAALAEFAELGLARGLPIAASHRRGIDKLLTRIESRLPESGDGLDLALDNSIRVAIVGRPNAGKSTLVNRLLGEDRVVVSDQAGTTRDAIHVPLERDGVAYTLIDTAGIRRRARVEDAVEKFSVLKALAAIESAQVVVLLVDAHENLAEQDLTLIGHVLEAGRALVLGLNKWDGLDSDAREDCRRALDRRLDFVDWAPRVTLSAQHGSGLKELMRAVQRAHASANREFGTAELTR